MVFFTVITLLIAQRFYELKIAKKNTRIILRNGGVEFGADHYWVIVFVHTVFFMSMVFEALKRGLHPPSYLLVLVSIFLAAQAARVWIIKTMKGRWTTRILVLPNQPLVTQGPFRFLSHPNYTVVAIEILVLPLMFGLIYTAFIFTILNAMVLLLIRIPEEHRALNWGVGMKKTMSLITILAMVSN